MLSALSFANLPPVKWSTKEVIGGCICLLALCHLYIFAKCFKSERLSANKNFYLYTGNASILLSTAATPLGVKVTRAVTRLLFTSQQIERVFRRTTTFPATIAAVALALPSIFASTALLISAYKDPAMRKKFRIYPVTTSTLFTSAALALVAVSQNLLCRFRTR